MPCDTIQTAGIELGKVDPALMSATLSDLNAKGIRVWQASDKKWNVGVTNGGKWTLESATAQVKQAYSHQVVLSQAKKYGWQVTKTSENQYRVVRR